MLIKNNSKTLSILFIGMALLIAGCSGETNTDDAGDRTFGKIELDMGASKSVSTGSTDNGDVSIELTPHEITDGKLSVDIAVNTHTVDLSSFDLTQITTLEINGNSLKPVSALQLGGHHASGSLVFEGVDASDSFTITITGIPAVNERVFRWSE